MRKRHIFLGAAFATIMATHAAAQGLQFRMQWSPDEGPRAELLIDAPFGGGSGGGVPSALDEALMQGAAPSGGPTSGTPGKADLVIVGLQARRLAEGRRDGICRFSVSYGVRNAGSATAARSVAMLAINGRTPSGFHKRVPALRPGQVSSNLDFTFGLKAGGKYRLLGSADGQNAVAEKSERNNDKGMQITCPK